MKTLKNLFLVLFVSLIAVSCSSDESGGGGGTAAAGTITAKIDGSTFTSNSQFTMATKTNTGASTTVTLQGSDNSGEALVIIMNAFTGVGTYNIGGGANLSVTASYILPNVSNPTASQSFMAPFDDTVAGEIEITEVSDTNVKGTFYFMAKNSQDGSTKEFTNGSFNIDFN
ncbi:MAG TPA: DUF6252 family protein [Salinimicrobium sp.]|nr:DUF6252 family protein [Salinimicrobium sp.]